MMHTLRKKLSATRKQSGGYTLSEILVVILIIGVLMMIVTVSIRKSRREAQNKEAVVQLEMISNAVEQLAWDTGMMPGAYTRIGGGDPEEWDLTTDDAGLLGTDGDFPNWRGPYLREIPRDPWGNRYFFDSDYRVGSEIKMVVGSFGPNGKGRNVYDKDNIYVLVGE